MIEFRPQAGKQTDFLSNPADIVIYGGGAGGGKTFGLIMEAARNIHVMGYGATIFRSEFNQISKQGGLWDKCSGMYPSIGASANKTQASFEFRKSGSRIDLSYITRNDDCIKWQGTEITLICFDELTHFSKFQFTYMLSRNRTMCGVKPYVRATCNASADSWVAKLIDPYIKEDGIADEEQAGRIRWLVSYDDNLFLFDTKDEAKDKFPGIIPKSFAFIPSTVEDNKALLDANPEYLSNLQALPRVEKERLLYGNWKIVYSSGDFFKREDFEIVDAIPGRIKMFIRAWDFAATVKNKTNDDPDYTASMKIAVDEDNKIYIVDVTRRRMRPLEVEKALINTAKQDGQRTAIIIPEDPGAAGKTVAERYIRLLVGYNIKKVRPTGSKQDRAKPASSQAQAGNIAILRKEWNNVLLNELSTFPQGTHDDLVDVLSDCVNSFINARAQGRIIKRPKQFDLY